MQHRKFVLLLAGTGLAVLALAGAVQAQTRAAAESQAAAIADLHALLAAAGEAGTESGQPELYVTDDEEYIGLAVPAHWRDTRSGLWTEAGRDGIFVEAAPDLEAFHAGDGPGVFFGMAPEEHAAPSAGDQPAAAARAQSARALAGDPARPTGCVQQEAPRPYTDPFLAGVYTIAAACAPNPAAQHVTLWAMPLTRQYTVTLRATTLAGEDRAALRRILRTFQVMSGDMSGVHGEADHEH